MIQNKVTIIDYGLGNLLSVKRAFEYLNVEVSITDSPTQIEKADRLILPGVGAFPRGMEELRKRNLIDPIKKFSESGRPLFGICLGMQLLMEIGEEHVETEGLNLIKGKVVKFPRKISESDQIKTPFIGWGDLNLLSKHSNYEKFRIFEGKQMYFVHSYFVIPEHHKDTLATTKNNNFEFCSITSSKNILGCQFHPEKSGINGLNLLKNFMII